MDKSKGIVLVVLATIFIALGLLWIADRNADEVISEEVLGEELIIKDPIIKPIEPIIPILALPIGKTLKNVTALEKTSLIGQFKGKTLKNGKLIQGSLTEDENNLLMEIIEDKYKGVQINSLPPEAFGISVITGKTILKLEYLINNL